MRRVIVMTSASALACRAALCASVSLHNTHTISLCVLCGLCLKAGVEEVKRAAAPVPSCGSRRPVCTRTATIVQRPFLYGLACCGQPCRCALPCRSGLSRVVHGGPPLQRLGLLRHGARLLRLATIKLAPFSLPLDVPLPQLACPRRRHSCWCSCRRRRWVHLHFSRPVFPAPSWRMNRAPGL